MWQSEDCRVSKLEGMAKINSPECRGWSPAESRGICKLPQFGLGRCVFCLSSLFNNNSSPLNLKVKNMKMCNVLQHYSSIRQTDQGINDCHKLSTVQILFAWVLRGWRATLGYRSRWIYDTWMQIYVVEWKLGKTRALKEHRPQPGTDC